MASKSINATLPLVVITGPTASGKTALAIDLAKRFGGEIICADSRTVYKHMNIGTAKPSMKERRGVPHWGLGLVEPGGRFTVADFQCYAQLKISEIRARNKVPILVGGTGLYIDSVIFNYQFGHNYDPLLRQQLVSKGQNELYKYCINNNIKLPQDQYNVRRLVQAIEQNNTTVKRQYEPIDMTIVVGIATNSDVLRTRIVNRAEQFLTNGVVKEATMLGKKYGWESEAMTGNAYPIIRRYLIGELSEMQVVEKMATSDWQLAKRQMTWFRRNPYIYWGSSEQLRDYVKAVLEGVV